MRRAELERLSKAELIELVLRLQRPEKTSRTSSKPPSTDRKERRERAKPGGAKPGHAGHSRPLSDDVSERIVHRPEVCPCCRVALAPDLPAEEAGTWERIELPAVRPQVVRHHRLAVRCPGCGTRAVAPVPVGGTHFGPRLHPVATYLKTYQALSYERLQAALADLFGLRLSQGGLMNLLRRAQDRFQAGREAAVAALRRAEVVASDETGVRIEGCSGYGIVNLAGCKARVTARRYGSELHAAIWTQVSCRHTRKASARARRYRAALIRCRRGGKWPWIMACAGIAN